MQTMLAIFLKSDFSHKTLCVELSNLNITLMVTWILNAKTCKFTSQLTDDCNCEVLLPWFGLLF